MLLIVTKMIPDPSQSMGGGGGQLKFQGHKD